MVFHFGFLAFCLVNVWLFSFMLYSSTYSFLSFNFCLQYNGHKKSFLRFVANRVHRRHINWFIFPSSWYVVFFYPISLTKFKQPPGSIVLSWKWYSTNSICFIGWGEHIVFALNANSHPKSLFAYGLYQCYYSYWMVARACCAYTVYTNLPPRNFDFIFRNTQYIETGTEKLINE